MTRWPLPFGRASRTRPESTPHPALVPAIPPGRRPVRDAVADAISAYLNDDRHRDHRRTVVMEVPLPREFPVRLARWWPLVVHLDPGDRREDLRSALGDL